MEKTGQIIITVRGRKGNFDLNPDNYDIRDLIEMLRNAEHMLFPNAKKDRPVIAYEMGAGSVRHIIKTALQTVIGFNALLAQIKAENYSLDFLELPTARAFEFFLQEAQKNDHEFEIGTSISDETSIMVNKNTRFSRSLDVWVEAEFYFYGTIVDAGGKGVANVHLDTKEYGLLKLEADKPFLANIESNPLYKSYGIRAKGRQNVISAEIDKNSLQLIEIIDYDPSFKEDYLNSLIQKARKSWADVQDADEWLQHYRGYGA